MTDESTQRQKENGRERERELHHALYLRTKAVDGDWSIGWTVICTNPMNIRRVAQ